MAAFRAREVAVFQPFKNIPRASRSSLQLFIVLFVLGASFGVLFLVMNAKEELACDYTDAIDHCQLEPFYRTEFELENAMKDFGHQWLMMAQDLRNDTEKQKCEVETDLIKDLTALHHAEARRIIRKCHTAFQKCVDELRVEASYTTTTTTRTTTAYVYVKQTTVKKKSDCQTMAEGSSQGSSMSSYLDCITGGKVPEPTAAPAGGEAGMSGPPPDCTRCDSFCRAFNWTQLDPGYASAMNYTSWKCGSKVCPWIPECGAGLNLHKNCSERGCPCERAGCPASASGGRLLQRAAGRGSARALEGHGAVPSPAGGGTTTTTRFVPYTTTTTPPESLENNTNCTCKPGLVDIVLVGRPFKVFFGDPQQSMMRRRRSFVSNSSGGRRALNKLDEDAERKLADLYGDENIPIEYTQGVHIEMEEEIIITRERMFDCRNYFSDRYKYVYPRTRGEAHTWEALLARQSHPDLGCGYKGFFSVACLPDFVTDNDTGVTSDSGNCSYKVDISTCVPPTYAEAIDECYVESSWSAGQSAVYVPKINEFLDIEDLNLTTAELPNGSVTIEDPPGQSCCEAHVGSECVVGRDYHGTINGTWMPEQSYLRQSGYFPVKSCEDQAKLTQHICPRVKIKTIEGTYQQDMIPQCFVACNLTSAQEELASVCDSSVYPETKEKERAALDSKIAWMTSGRAKLQAWAKANWPLVGQTEKIIDCVDNIGSRRYNMVGWPASGSFDKLKLRYECRMHDCSATQCVKVTRQCPIPQMSMAPESQCETKGDQNLYTCVDKVTFSSQGMVSAPLAYCWLALSVVCFFSSCGACFQATCGSKKSRVVPYTDITDEAESNILYCDTCNEPLDTDAIAEGSATCMKCIAKTKRPEVCSNCGEAYEDPEDNFCVHCRQPREMAALTMGGSNCPQCYQPMGENDAKCNECGWHREDAIVLRADTGPMRASANSAANESRIVPVDIGPTDGKPLIAGQE